MPPRIHSPGWQRLLEILRRGPLERYQIDARLGKTVAAGAVECCRKRGAIVLDDCGRWRLADGAEPTTRQRAS